MVAELDRAASETQFTRAIETIKPSIPESLMIRGSNPLILLHGALSQNLHAASDAECLAVAESIRVVLAELAKKMDIALKEDEHIAKAITVLAKQKAQSGVKPTKT